LKREKRDWTRCPKGARTWIIFKEGQRRGPGERHLVWQKEKSPEKGGEGVGLIEQTPRWEPNRGLLTRGRKKTKRGAISWKKEKGRKGGGGPLGVRGLDGERKGGRGIIFRMMEEEGGERDQEVS